MVTVNNLKAFFTNKITLLLAFIGGLFVAFNVLLVILQIDVTQTVAITRYNLIESPQFTRGHTRSLYAFAIAPVVFYLIHILIAARAHAKHKELAIFIMALGFVVLLFGIFVSSAIINVNK